MISNNHNSNCRHKIRATLRLSNIQCSTNSMELVTLNGKLRIICKRILPVFCEISIKRPNHITVSTKVNRLKTRRNTQLVVLRGSHQSHIGLRRIILTAIAGKVITKALACYSINRAIRKTWCCWIILSIVCIYLEGVFNSFIPLWI